MQNAAQTYQSNQVTTATPGELTLMLYNGALRFIKMAKTAIEQQDIVKAHESIIRVQDIVNELIITLNREVPISEQFLIMYEYMQRQLIQANVTKDISILEEVEGYFTEFRDTWKQVMAISKQQG